MGGGVVVGNVMVLLERLEEGLAIGSWVDRLI